MRKFKVNVTGHQLKNQIVAKYGTIVNEDQLNGNSSELEKQGFIKEVFDEETEEIKGLDLSKLSKKELVQFALDNEFEIDEKLNAEKFLAELEKQIELSKKV